LAYRIRTTTLAQTIRRAGLDVFQTFNEVGLAVKRSTGGAQPPWVSSSPIDGSFYFAAPPAVSPSAAGATRANEAATACAVIQNTTSVAVMEGLHPTVRHHRLRQHGSRAARRIETE
jgi:hypothetical protein